MIKNINHRMQYFYKTVKGVSVFHVGVLGFFALRLTYTFRNYLGKFLNFKPDKKTFPKNIQTLNHRSLLWIGV